jgi:hypothetical protein
MNDSPQPRPFQFGINTLLALTFFVAVLFGLLRWMGATPVQSLIVVAILTVAFLAAGALIITIAKTSDRR